MLAPVGRRVQLLLGTLSRRGPLLCLGLAALASVGMLAARISGHLGFELALGANVLAGALGGACGVAAARRELAEPAPCGLRAAALGAGTALVVALIPLVLALGKRLFAPGCNDAAGLLWYALLPLPSALCAGTAGALSGLAARGRWRAGVFYAALACASLGWSLWPLMAGPQAFAFNALFGWFPGPLYDEDLRVTAPLLAHRAITLGWTLAATLGCVATFSRRRAPGAAALVLSAGLLALGRAPALGMHSTVASIAAALGGARETVHFIIHYPGEKSEADVRRLAEDHETRYAQVVRDLGAAPKSRLRSFVYRSAEEKRRLMGAANTELSKPWRGEVHIVDRGYPHPALRHEIAHAVAAAFSTSPFGVAGSGLAVNMGLTEGLAAAVGGEREELTIHQWARVLLDLGRAPRLAEVMALRGFWAEAPGRAYAWAGSVVAWLLETRGAQVVRAAYATGDLEGATGDSLEALERAHREFLAGVDVPPEGRAHAELRLSRPSIFQRPCAREVAALRKEADALARLSEADAARAVALYERCAALDALDPGHLLGRAFALARAGRMREARTAARAASDHPGAGGALRADAAMLVGDLSWKLGEPDAATTAWAEALALHKDRATDRLARAKTWAASDPLLAKVALPWLLGDEGDRTAALVRLRELVDALPTSALAPYLLGRALVQGSAPAEGARFLELAIDRGLAPPDLRAEALRQAGFARWLAGEAEAARAHFAALAEDPGATLAERALAADWLERIALTR